MRHLLLCALALNACGEAVPLPSPAEEKVLQQIQQNPKARVLLCDSAGPSCEAKRDSLLPSCLSIPQCQLYTVRKSQHPWLWAQLAKERTQKGL